MVILFFAASAFLFGMVFGSFLNVCIYRLPKGLSVVHPRSACPACGAPVQARDNIPVLSWFLLRGLCRSCKAPISPRYWVVELLTGMLFLASFLKFGLSVDTLKLCVFSFLVLGLIFTDADEKILPDALTIPGFWLGIGFSLLSQVEGFAEIIFAFHPRFLFHPEVTWRLISVTNALTGAGVGALMVWSAGALWKLLRGVEAMGFGDVKLMAMAGAFLGIKLTILTLLLASFSGSVGGVTAMTSVYYRRLRRYREARLSEAQARQKAAMSAMRMLRGYQMPFGIFLGGAALVSAFAGDGLMRWYMGLFL